MFKALDALWLAVITLFTATNRIAQTVDNLAQWAEDETKSFNDQAKVERAAKLRTLKADTK